jgi:hypothetical protein
VNANDGTVGQPGAAAAAAKAQGHKAKPGASVPPGTTTVENSLPGTEGTTHSHSISTSTDGTSKETKDDTAAAGTSTVTTDVSATATPTTGATAIASTGFSGVGGPNGNLIDVAGEMLGDAARVGQVMRGGDRSMKASDLLNQAMLTMIQSGGNTPR